MDFIRIIFIFLMTPISIIYVLLKVSDNISDDWESHYSLESVVWLLFMLILGAFITATLLSSMISETKEYLDSKKEVVVEETVPVVKEVELPLVRDIEYYSNVYGLDHYLVLAIMRHETGNFEGLAYKSTHNACGIMDSTNNYKTLKVFDNEEQGVIECVRNLKRNYFDLGLVTIEDIGAKYAPVGSDNDNGYNQFWVQSVSAIYADEKSKAESE